MGVMLSHSSLLTQAPRGHLGPLCCPPTVRGRQTLCSHPGLMLVALLQACPLDSPNNRHHCLLGVRLGQGAHPPSAPGPPGLSPTRAGLRAPSQGPTWEVNLFSLIFLPSPSKGSLCQLFLMDGPKSTATARAFSVPWRPKLLIPQS